MNKNKLLQPQTKAELQDLIAQEISLRGYNCDLNHIDTSLIKDMSYLFSSQKFNGDISRWDVSNVLNMSSMFSYSEFNGDISKWDVSFVYNMSGMFEKSKFNQDISSWNVIRVNNMSHMFDRAVFNNSIERWSPWSLVQMQPMFTLCDAVKPNWLIEDKEKRYNYLRFRQDAIDLNESLKHANLPTKEKSSSGFKL